MSRFQYFSNQNTISPGVQSRMEFATGLLVSPISVNGNYMLVNNFHVYMTQEIDNKWFVQGGPRSSISYIGKKQVEGDFSFPLRIDRSGNIDPAAVILLNNASLPTSTIQIDTNHVLSNVALTATNGGSDNHMLYSLDNLIVKSLTISSSPEESVKVDVSVIGTIDNSVSDTIIPSPDMSLKRNLSWLDCNLSKYTSAMRTVSAFSIMVENQTESPVFLNSYTNTIRSDQISFVAVSQCLWDISYTETLRMGMDTETYEHGGIVQGDNVNLVIGNMSSFISTPLYTVGEQMISSGVMVRENKFTAKVSPSQLSNSVNLFNFSLK